MGGEDYGEDLHLHTRIYHVTFDQKYGGDKLVTDGVDSVFMVMQFFV